MMREFKRKSRILLVDDNAEHLRGVKELINLETSYDVVGATTSANVAINLIKKYRPDIVLMDINMPEKDGLQAIQEIERLELDVKVIALSGYDDSDLIFRAMKLSRFFEYFQRSFKNEAAAQPEENLLTYLTSREEEVLDLLTQGNNYKGIAAKLFISETTVKTHVNNIFQKLQVNDRTQAVLYALNNGFANRRRIKTAV